MSNLTNEVKRKAPERAKIEIAIEQYLQQGGAIDSCENGAGANREMSQREASVLAFKHNTAQRETNQKN